MKNRQDPNARTTLRQIGRRFPRRRLRAPLRLCVWLRRERLYEFVSRELRVTWKTKCNDTITTKRANKTYTIHQHTLRTVCVRGKCLTHAVIDYVGKNEEETRMDVGTPSSDWNEKSLLGISMRWNTETLDAGVRVHLMSEWKHRQLALCLPLIVPVGDWCPSLHRVVFPTKTLHYMGSPVHQGALRASRFP